MSHRKRVLILALVATGLACTEAAPPRPPEPPPHRPVLLPPPHQPPPPPPPEPEPPKLTWQQRTAIAIDTLQRDDPELYKKLHTLRPDRKVGDELQFTQPIAADPRAAPVFLQRLLNGKDSIAVRLALVDALPATGGDWQEGVAALVAIDASPRVRKKLVETLRYVAPPHDIDGLRLAFHDEDPRVRAAAARAAGFARDGIGLFQEVVSMTFDDEDWDVRAAAAQTLGKFQQKAAWPTLVRLLGDPNREVRLQALLALERIDADAARKLPELDALARDKSDPRLARLAKRLKAEGLKAETAEKAEGGAAPEPPPPTGARSRSTRETAQRTPIADATPRG
ncbi:MAG TPA: HEAT repeat domain-containing protein [Nannocystis sp.]